MAETSGPAQNDDPLQLPPPYWRPPQHWVAAETDRDLEAAWEAKGFARGEPSDWSVVQNDKREWAKWKASPDDYRADRIDACQDDVDHEAAVIRDIAERHGLSPRVVRAVLVDYLDEVEAFEFPAGHAVEAMRRAVLE